MSKQINPKLIHALLDDSSAKVPEKPTFKHLGGVYVKSVVDHIRKFEPPFGKNNMMLRCTQCGAKGQYDVGVVVVNPEKPKDKQYTGYFRCKQCNAAGCWDEPLDIHLLMMAAVLSPHADLPVHFGENVLSDGFRPTFGTDAEEHYLTLIAQDRQNALLWNKLGNVYKMGARPELAMAAYEKSIALDHMQIESHLSIAQLLQVLEQDKQAIFHYHQAMLFADRYEHLSDFQLRELIASAIANSFIITYDSKYKLNTLPSAEDIAAAGSKANLTSANLPRYLTLSSEDLTTFYPLAEAFLSPERPTPKRKVGTKAQRVEAFIVKQTEPFTKAHIQQACPDVSLATINKVVAELRKAGKIDFTGHGTAVRWFTI